MIKMYVVVGRILFFKKGVEKSVLTQGENINADLCFRSHGREGGEESARKLENFNKQI